MEPKNDIYKRSRFMYILEAGFEYLISLLVASSFLATLTGELGMSDSLTGIISSFISLGCVFQLFSMFIRRDRMKPFVTVMSIANQLLFMLLYVIPLSGGEKNVKITVFVCAIFAAYFIYNVAHPKKINMFMSTVDDGIRGRFTANKEIISLIMGMVFSFLMGALVDRFREKGEIRTAFIICAAVMFILTILHTATILLTREKPTEQTEQKGLFRCISEVLRDKNVLRVAAVFILWNIANYSTLPFYGTYQIKELGFSLTFVSGLQIVSSVARMLISRFWGSYADKKSFSVMIRVCFFVAAAGFFVNIFSSPATGIVFFSVYSVCHAVALGGINSALINLIFDYVPTEKRADSLAISQALSGLAGFLATCLVSPLVTYIQQNGNRLLGVPVYAQQVTSIIAFVFTVAVIIYVSIKIIPKKGDDR